MLFDWLMTGHIIETNPAHAVRGPKYVVKRGKTPVLAGDEARTLLDAPSPDTLAGLRDRAILAVGLQVGFRRAEIAALKVGDLHQNRGFAKVATLCCLLPTSSC